MLKITSKDSNEPTFSGLWLCPDVIVEEKAFFRSAILFLNGPRMHYILRFNHDAVEEGMTMEFIWDYRVTSTVIHQHPLNYPESTQIEVPWKRGDDGSLMLQFDEEWQRFYPAIFEQLFTSGFEREYVQEVVEEVGAEGWKYSLDARFPSFSGTSGRSSQRG